MTWAHSESTIGIGRPTAWQFTKVDRTLIFVGQDDTSLPGVLEPFDHARIVLGVNRFGGFNSRDILEADADALVERMAKWMQFFAGKWS